jgi:bifunctional UDP-N-acetylglucosamine pyrophosphorylase/glucosamine-1-phosphate N-acetyltransferase
MMNSIAMTKTPENSPASFASPASATPSATAIVLAAGEGTRMKSKHAKVVHQVLDRPMIEWVVDAVRQAGCGRIVVVVGSHSDETRAALAGANDVEFVEQTQRLGTGHAVRVALEQAGISRGPVLVTCGDTPLLRSETLANLVLAAFAGSEGEGRGGSASESLRGGNGGGALLTMTLADPTGYGRVMVDADGFALRIVEQKDATPEEAASTTCNAGVYCFDAASLAAHIGELTQDNAQREFYLTDMVSILAREGMPMRAFDCPDASELMGVNSRIQLAQVTRVMQKRINDSLMASGVTMLDPSQVWVGARVRIGRDTTILPGTMLYGETSVGEDCVIGPNTRLTDTTVGNGSVVDETVAISATIDNDVSCGPRAYLRPGAHLMDGSKAGTHVEIKNSTIGRGSKVPHLSYIGDTQMGEGVNIGAGSITCNYDGKNKHHTTIGDNVFVGSDTMMVAPVAIGDGATVGAGSVITHDVPAGALALERSEQRVIPGWLPRWKRAESGENSSAGDAQPR